MTTPPRGARVGARASAPRPRCGRGRAARGGALPLPPRALEPEGGADGMSFVFQRQEIRLHGHPVSYYEAGSGPVVLLVHGITSNADTWRAVMPALAERFTVVAPDLLGHGGSAKP